LYVVGERMLDNAFRSDLLNTMIRFMRMEEAQESSHIESNIRPPLQVVEIIYGGTTSGSPARRLLVDWCLGFGHQAEYNILHDKEFLLDIVKALSTKAENGLPSSAFRGVPLVHGDYGL